MTKVVEIVDLKNESFTCHFTNLAKFPIKTSNIAGAGVIQGLPMICTSYHGCYALKHKQWSHVVNLKMNRGGSSRGNVILDGKLYISGGIFKRQPQKSSELISSQTSIFGPALPQILFGHCIIKVNESTILITGGSSSSSRQVKDQDNYSSTFQNIASGQVNPGPKFNVPRFAHKCAKFNFGGKTYALVTYPGTHSSKYENPSLTMEVLNLDSPDQGWKVILDKPGEFQSIRGFEVIVNNEKDVFVVGGNKDKRAIFKLECFNDLKNCGWKKLRQRLRKGRSFLTAFSIPDSLAFELCDQK